MTNIKFPNLKDRFTRYAKINTRSNPNSTTIPSDPKEVAFLKSLAVELKKIGLKNVRTRKDGYLFAELPASKGFEKITPIGFISHADTADFNSVNIKPKLVKNYDGKSVIKLNKDYNLDPKIFPNLKNYKGQDLITTDGNTLLGADDKAGITEIITAMEYLVKNPEVKHGPIKVAFGPDEEIGIGANNFDVKNFGAKFAYTVDGGPLGDLNYETFNAAAATITFKGVAVHPAEAKDTLVNPNILLMEFNAMLPAKERPEHTDGRQGFYYLTEMSGTADSATVQYIIRDFDKKKFKQRKDLILKNVKEINKKAGSGDLVSIDLNDQYYNMAEVIQKDLKPINIANQAMKNVGFKPLISAIRGGTDGSKITFLGLPTPNLFSGAENMHGRFEFVSVQTMEKATNTILEIINLVANKSV